MRRPIAGWRSSPRGSDTFDCRIDRSGCIVALEMFPHQGATLLCVFWIEGTMIKTSVCGSEGSFVSFGDRHVRAGNDMRCSMAQKRRLFAAIIFQIRHRPTCRNLLASVSMMLTYALFACATGVTAPCLAAQDEHLTVSDAWVSPMLEVGRDVPLLVTVRNDGNLTDSLTRIRCPVANFAEKHTVDRGEGAPAMRAIASIPIASGSTVVFKPTEYHVMLLQTRQPLRSGDKFKCMLVFQKAGSIEADVEVR